LRDALKGTHNGYSLVVDVCLLVELLLELSVFLGRPRLVSDVIMSIEGKAQGQTYWTPLGCRAVLLTVLETMLRSEVL
jgi:hypothetical protein